MVINSFKLTSQIQEFSRNLRVWTSKPPITRIKVGSRASRTATNQDSPFCRYQQNGYMDKGGRQNRCWKAGETPSNEGALPITESTDN